MRDHVASLEHSRNRWQTARAPRRHRCSESLRGGGIHCHARAQLGTAWHAKRRGSHTGSYYMTVQQPQEGLSSLDAAGGGA